MVAVDFGFWVVFLFRDCGSIVWDFASFVFSILNYTYFPFLVRADSVEGVVAWHSVSYN